ncbi:unnamed protein product [Mytilus edulis]|uniref:Uncharacterized protein n=1 Tax=Mytilus edulis TaxID=6550 RepID=A0A8S3TAT0_MYTED|nr:unnamed protein product [Mytilus edulis]
MGGGWFSRTSSPAEALCLPHDPDFVTKDSATTDFHWVSSLYGAEYHSGTGPYNHDVPCAVCRATLSEFHGPYNHDVPCAVCRATLSEYQSGTGPYNHDVPCAVCRATLSEYHSGTGPYNHDVPCAVCRATLSEYHSGTGPYNHDVPCAVCRATLSEYHSGTGPYNHDVPCAVCRATLSEYHSGTGPYNHDVPCAVCRATLSEYHSGTGPYNHDVPCAVCRATLCSSVIMIPGKTSCYSGWKTEYFGRMSASSNYHKASSQYTCIDENPDVLEAGGADKDGYLINPVRAVCGSLRCPPFYDNALLTCVVCSS